MNRELDADQTPPAPLATVVTLLFVLLGWTGAPQAGEVSLELTGGRHAVAEYLEHGTRGPAILVLHGFLQTHQFLATQSVIEGLAAQGYTVLAPNLTLGTPRRRQSMDCAAAHSHRLEDDLREIGAWIDWLEKRGFRKVILVGQSWGSQHAIAYQSRKHDPRIAAIVGISLVRDRLPAERRRQAVGSARRELAARPDSLGEYPLNFCARYVASPASFLSYAEFDDDAVIAAVKSVKVPVHTILGTADKRIDDVWIRALQGSKARVITIQDANHFFTAMHEFELQDRIGEVIKSIIASR